MRTEFVTPLLAGLCAALLMAADAAAQSAPVRVIVHPEGGQLTPEQIKAQIEAAILAGSATNAAPAGPEPKELAEAIGRMSFQRTPDALLQAVRSQQGASALSEAERFRIAVLLGDWPSVGATLKALAPPDGRRAYARLLDALASGSQSATQFYQQSGGQDASSGQMQGAIVISEGGQPSPRHSPDGRRSLLLSDDFYAVIAAAPSDLDESALQPVAALARIAIGPDGKQQLLARLEGGLKGFGGKEPAGRRLAAQLLSALEWIADAGPYLPLQREQWDGADTLSLLLTMEHFTQTGLQQRDERQFRRAAELCAFMMQTSRFSTDDRGLFRQAADRFVKLLPALGAEEAETLIRESFLTQPAILTDLMITLGEAGQQAQRGQDLNLRGQSLATQSSLLRVLAGRKSDLPQAVNLLVLNWLTEAETTYRSGVVRTVEDEPENPYIYRPPSYYARRNVAKVVTPDIVLTNAPAPALIRRLNKGLAQRVNLTLLKVSLMDPKGAVTLDALRGYLKEHPGHEKSLCLDYLTAWVKQRIVLPEDPNIVRMRNLGYSIGSQQRTADGIPLTRLRQNRNVAEFRDLLVALRALSPEPLPAAAVVDGFMGIHSGAEVYRAADIEAIFGPPESMDRAELMQLVTGMRGKLRTQWQDAKAQQSAGTNRTEQEAKDEVSRGYQAALDLVKRGLKEQDAEWKQFIVRGQLFFDAAEFEFARQVKLTDYVSLRDEAFASYRKAAQIYAAAIPQLPKAQWTLEPYQMWFFVMLGASDLSQLTRAAARSDPGLSQIGDAMRALPEAAAGNHLQKFGSMLASLLPQVPANMRQRFLSAGLQVVGESHPAAAAAQASLKNYQELLDETELRIALDGPARVGHADPFGVFISLEHTRQIARESGGFGKYLQNAPGQKMMAYAAPGSDSATYRDNFAKNIHGALDESFDVVSITFHDADVRAIDLPREGWQETPLAYVVLRAKEAAVDRIPSIQLDMDFSDFAGKVVLPIRSQVEPLDARDTDAEPRPCAGLTLTFTMDEREWADSGRAVVDVSARGNGVIPPHTRLFAFEQPGFDVEVTDNGLTVGEFVSDGSARVARADRGWQFVYKRRKDLRGAAVLKFPALKPGVSPGACEYQHYRDADLEKLDAAAAAAGVPLRTAANTGLRAAAMVLLPLAALAAGALLLRGRKRRPGPAAAALALPGEITPFTVIAFLRRIEREAGGALDEAARSELKAQLAELESRHFRRAPAGGEAQDLAALASKWMERTR